MELGGRGWRDQGLPPGRLGHPWVSSSLAAAEGLAMRTDYQLTGTVIMANADDPSSASGCGLPWDVVLEDLCLGASLCLVKQHL